MVILCLMSLALWGCQDFPESSAFPASGPVARTSPVFDPFYSPVGTSTSRVRAQNAGADYLAEISTIARLPMPNDLMRDPQSGFNALPAPRDATSDYLPNAVAAINELQGWSTGGRLAIPLSGPVDLETVTPETLLVISQSDGSSAPVTASFEHDGEGQRLLLTPLVALHPDTPYLVILTQGVLDEQGLPLISGPLLEATKSRTPSDIPTGGGSAASFEGIRQRMQPVWLAAEQATGQNRAGIPLAFTFTTQSLFTTMQGIRESVHRSTITATVTESYTTPEAIDTYYKTQLNVFHKVVPDANGNPVSGPDGEVAAHENVGGIYVGTIPAPWYIDDNLKGPSFQPEGNTVKNFGTRPLEFLAILPKGDGDFPVTIFQHGLTRTKKDLAGIANTWCGQGRAMIGIDLVLHGANNPKPKVLSDGFDFVNQEYPTMMRDNVRQSVANLMVLNRLITSGNARFGTQSLRGAATSYIGHSEGAFVGGSFAPLESDNASAILACGSAQSMISTQANSARVGATFDLALQQLGGILPGTIAYREYYFIAQTLMDDADPFNYLPHAEDGSLRDGAAAGAILLQDMFEAINLPPIVVAEESQIQARSLGAPQVAPLRSWPGVAQVAAPYRGSGEFQFQGGGHNAIWEASEGPPEGATSEACRRQAFHFIESAEQGQAEIINVFRGPDPPGE